MKQTFVKINNFLKNHMWLLAPLAILVGILLGDKLSDYRSWAIYIFAFLTFTGSIRMRLSDFQRIIKKPLPILVFLFYAHIVMPLIGFLLSSIFFQDNNTILGYILWLSGPVAVVSFIWADIYDGDGALNLSLIIIDTLITPILMPLTAKILIGDNISINIAGMIKSLIIMIVIPLILGLVINELSKGKAKEKVSLYIQPFGKLALFIALFLTISKVSNTVLNLRLKDFGLLLLNLTLTTIAFVLGYYNQIKALKDKENISISCGMGLRNNTVTLIIATTYYSPIVALPIVAGLIFQQLLASTVCKLIFKRK